MTDVGEYILVDTNEAQKELPSLLQAVCAGRRVQISQNGKPIAELRAPAAGDRLRPHPDLSPVRFNSDPMEPLDPEDWPEDLR